MHTPSPPALSLADGLTRDYLRHHRLCPKALAPDDTLVVAAAPDAYVAAALDDIACAYGRTVVVEAATHAEVDRLIERLVAGAERLVELERASEPDSDADDLGSDARDLASQPPVVRYVNALVRDAYDAAASDIHLEAARTGLVARFRLDGVLVPAAEPPNALAHAVVSRVKLLAELDIAERRRPQDGRIRVRLESRELDLRVSTVPTMFGESVVLRLLDRGGRPVALGELGMPPAILQDTTRLTARPHGLVLVTGPTGSGKTTTLYAALQRRDATAEKIITVEDPVEYQLTGITQMPVHRQAGVTFGSALRSILRQDPDVVMIGEMRDAETAEVAIQASMTGHLVLSTLHTNDALGAVPRLLDLGVAPYLAAAVLEGVLAQRLVRRTCDECRVSYEPSPDAVASLRTAAGERAEAIREFTRGVGCRACRGTGFRGRLGLFELLLVSDEIRDVVARGSHRAELRRAAGVEFRTLRADGWTKVSAGQTTVEEVLRVVHA